MKIYLLLLLLVAVSIPAFADDDQFKHTGKFSFGGEDGDISKSDCANIEKLMNDKLQSFAKSENLPLDTFTVKTKSYYNHNSHKKVVNYCHGLFSSKNTNYDYVENEGVKRYGSDRNAQCVSDQQKLEKQSNVLAIKTYVDDGWSFNLDCFVKSIFIERLN